jgi:predicted lipase
VDWMDAIHYAKLVQAAEAVLPTAICEPTLTVTLREAPTCYTVLANIFANDLATRANERRKEMVVSIGYIAQDEDGNVVIVLRGTHGVHEWIHDLLYEAVPCPFLADAGCTEDGFTDVYMSLRVDREHGAARLVDYVAQMGFPRPLKSLTVCGHSLGAALATLLALDLVANTQYKDLTLYNFASPRTGDERFAEVFNRLVPNTYRIANRKDLVTEVPPIFLSHKNRYAHVESTTVLVPHQGVREHVMCMHHLSTYTHLMAKEAGLDLSEYPIRKECCEETEGTWVEQMEQRIEHRGEMRRQAKVEAASLE